MYRVNPKLIRIPSGEYAHEEWITDGARNTIRLYRLLFKINNQYIFLIKNAFIKNIIYYWLNNC